MNIRIQVIIAAIILAALGIIINMIRKKALELKYALAWLAVGVGILILDLFPGLMKHISDFMGIELPINMLFFFGFCFALALIFILTIMMSRMSNRIKELTQELALFEKKVNDERTKEESK